MQAFQDKSDVDRIRRAVRFVERQATKTSKTMERRAAPASRGSSSTNYLCRITAISSTGVYSVDLHRTKSETKVGTGQMEIVNLHPSEFIAVGDWVVGTPFLVKEIVLIDAT